MASPFRPKSSPRGMRAGPGGASSSIPDEAHAFDEYKQGAGSEINAAYVENRTTLKEKKVDFRTLSLRVNQAKHDIDDLTRKVTDKRAGRPVDESAEGAAGAAVPVLDEEEFALVRELKAKKKLYQQAFHDRKMVENEVSYLKGLVAQTKVRLCNEFLVWYQDTYHVTASSESMAAVTMAMAESDEAVDRSLGATKPGGGKSVSMAAGGDEEQLDDGEQFEKMERERIMSDDPESLSYHTALKMTAHSKAMGKKKVVGAAGGTRK